MAFRYPTIRVGQFTETTRSFTLYATDAPSYDDRVLDLTGAVGVTVSLEHANYGWVPVDGGECTITDATAGEVEYTFSALETVVPGQYFIQFEVDWGTETELIPPSGNDWTVHIGRRLPTEGMPVSVKRIDADDGQFGSLYARDAEIASGTATLESANISDLSATTIRGSVTNNNTWRGIGGGLQFDAEGRLYVAIEDYGTIDGLTNPLTADLQLNNYAVQGPGPVGTKTNPVGSATIEDVRRTESEWPRHMATTRAGEQLDALNDLTNWTVVDGSAAVVGTGYYGGDAIQLSATATGLKSAIDRAFAEPQNFSEVDFTMAVRIDSFPGTSGAGPRIILSDAAGNRHVYRGSIKTAAAGKWIRCTFGFDSGFEEAAVDLSNITNIRIQVQSPDAHQWTINDLRTVEKPEKGAILFTFDDGNDSDFIHGFPILGKYGFSGTSFVNTAGIGGAGKMTWTQLETMQSRGWEVCSHGEQHDNLETMTEPAQRAHLSNARRDLRERGFWRGSRAHRTTHSAYDATSLDLMSQYFELSATDQNGMTGGTAAIGDSRLVRAQPCDDYVRAKDVIRHTAEQRHLTLLTFHRIADLDAAAFEDVVSTAKDLVDADDLDVLTMTDLLDPTIGYGVGPGGGGDVKRYADEGSFAASGDAVGVVSTATGDRLAWKTE